MTTRHVTPAANGGNHHQYYPQNSSSSAAASFRGCCCCLFLLFSFIALLILAVVLIIFLAVKPKKPEFELQQVGVQYMGINPTTSSSATVSMNIRMLFTAANDNKVGIKYGESRFTVMYRGIPLGRGFVPGFFQPAHSVRRVVTTIVVDRVSLLQADAVDLVRDAALNDRVELRVVGDVGAKIRIMGLTSPGVQTGQQCSIPPPHQSRKFSDSQSATSMDFSALNEALAFKSYDQIADICDNLMLQVASEGVAFHDEWPYAVHLLGHIYINDINSARFLWKKIPSAVKESQPELSAVWKIGQRLWVKDYGGVHEALREFNWSPQTQIVITAFSEVYTKRMFDLLLSAYSTISIQDAALFFGMNEDAAANYAVERGWIVDPATRMLTVKKQAVATEQKLDPSKLQRLTEYVFHLEH